MIETTQAGKSLKLTWDNLNRLIQSDHNGQITYYGYDVFGRRLYKKNQQNNSLTLFGWDGDLMVWESYQNQAKSENTENKENLKTQNYTKHYVSEPNSFVPLLQTGYTSFIKLIEAPDYRQFKDVPYSIYKDPVWNTETRKNKAELERIVFYHCDQVGTPQTLSNERGECVWEMTQNTWGTTHEIKTSDNLFEQTNLRFQGQYYDSETGLHYNRYRYYEPYSARYVSKDPIGLFGGLNTSAYVSDPNQWIDPMGLAKKQQKKDPFREVKGTTPFTKYVNNRILESKLGRQATEKDKRQAEKIFNNQMSEYYTNCEEQLVEYISCSGGVGPFAGGFSVNLYNGKIFATGSGSPVSVPNAMINTINKGPMSLKDFSKLANNNVFAKGGECVGGYVVNKKIRDPKLAIDSFLTGKATTYGAGGRGLRGGVVIPDGEKLFDSNGIKGIQLGVGTQGADMSIGYGYDTGYKLELLNKK